MSRVFNLNNKLIKVSHRIRREEFLAMDLPREEFEKRVTGELIGKIAEYVIKKLPMTISRPDDNHENAFIWSTDGYILTQKEMLEVIIEITDLDEKGLNILNLACREELGNTI